VVIYRVPHSYLNDYAMIGQRLQVLMDTKRKDIDQQEQQEIAKLLAIQESHRLLRNYNYDKDTEWLRQYAFAESIREQRLVQIASSVGLYIDRYI
jgi:3-oxoacyl-ACP reductase-like protein